MIYDVTHITEYQTDEPVSLCHNVAWVTPRTTLTQTCEKHELVCDPPPSVLTQRWDSFGNSATHFSFNEGYRGLCITAKSLVMVSQSPPLNPAGSPSWEEVRDRIRAYPEPEDFDAVPFLFDSPRIQRAAPLGEYAAKSFSPFRPILEGLLELTSRIHRDFEYDPRATTVTTPVLDVMQHRRGVCQDFAHLEIAMLRSLGLAARYVSGYVRTIPPPGQERLAGADASHAWLSVYCGDLGWVDVDPTNDKLISDEHITLAWGRDYSDVSPIKGVYVGGRQHTLSVSVDVVPMD